MAPMTPEQIRSFLGAGTRTAKLATVRAGGRPDVVPVWFVLDGDDAVFTTGAESVKGQDRGRYMGADRARTSGGGTRSRASSSCA
jgi:hypothetical protein